MHKTLPTLDEARLLYCGLPGCLNHHDGRYIDVLVYHDGETIIAALHVCQHHAQIGAPNA